MPKFYNARKFNKTSIKNLPEEKPILYLLQNNPGDELYLGVAKRGRVQERLREHLTLKKEKIPGAAKVKFTQFSSIKKAKKTEKQLIKKLEPKFNEQNK
jgi:excinuclease UvrABC nuclease subunit